MHTIDIVISNKLGLHARAAAKLTQLAGKFSSEIFIARGERRVNAKSIMGVLMLAAGQGITVRLDAEGGDAAEALQAIQALFEDKFGEGE
ncbi:MAG: HPr family phosphocarrier protein [Corticimicrobacter sp.]|uniref:HPr family phosphocarrier protein n=1 Tax=Corticimicrobacter sp. TaxID=2678536 RepID=UPI0032DAB3C8